ncbi:MAG: YhdP family protein [Gammaproteobacteria bacterium]
MARRLVRWVWALSALLVIAYALLVAAGRELLPRLDHLQPRLDSVLSERLGAVAEARHLNGAWTRLSPHLWAGSVRLSSASGRPPFLVMDALDAEVDLFRSLFARRPVWSDLSLARLQISLAETPTGWALDGSAPNTQGAARQVVDMLLASRRTRIARAEITLHFRSGVSELIAANHLVLENSGDFHRLGAALEISGEEFAAIQAEWRGGAVDGADWSALQGRSYLKLSRLNLSGSLGVILRGLAPDWARRLAPVAVPMNAEIWLTATGNEHIEVVGRVATDSVPLGAAPTASPLRDLKADITGWLGPDDWGLRLQGLAFTWNERDIAPLTLEFRQRLGADGPRFSLAADHLDVGTLNAMALAGGLLPQRAAEVLAALDPTGRLVYPRVDIDLGLPGRVTGLQATLENVAVASWRGSPAVTGVSGQITATGHGGVLTLDGATEVAMLFPEAYDNFFRVGQVRGQVGFTLDDDYSTLKIQGAPLDIQAADGAGRIRAAFSLHQPLAPGAHGELWLTAGIRDSDAAYARQYIPRELDPELLQWLDRALGDMRVVEGGFIWRGAIEKEAGPRRATQVYARVADGAIAYDPEWPGLTDVSAYVAVDGVEVSGRVKTAMVAGVPVRDVQFRTVAVAGNSKPLLAVTGTATTEVSQALGVLTQSPLRSRVEPLRDWQAQGPVAVALDLRIPLSKQHTGERYRVVAKLADAALTHRGSGLKFERIRGDITFSEVDGLAATGLAAHFWDRELRATIHTDAHGETRIEAGGRMVMEDLPVWPDWLRGPVAGETAYSASYRIPGDKTPPQLVVESRLEGVHSDLPAPFAKMDRDAPLPLTARLTFGAETIDADVHLGADLAARARWEDGRMQRAEIAFGGVAAELPTAPGLSVRGHLDALDIDAWREHLPTAAEPRDLMMVHLPRLKLQIGTLQAAGLQIDGIDVSGAVADGAWRMHGDSATAAGDLVVPLDGSPFALHLNHLVLPKPDFASDQGVLSRFDPRSLPELEFSTQGLRLGERELGHIGLTLRRAPDGVRASAIRGEITGLVVGSGEGSSSLLWRRWGEHDQTRFESVLESENLAGVLRSWELPGAIESERATFATALEWDDKPWKFSARTLRGDVGLQIVKGSFHRTSGAASSVAMKLIGLINFDTWLRRLRLDFSDLFETGMSFDELKTTLAFDVGMLNFAQPVKVELPSGKMRLEGRADLIAETIDAHLVATLPVGTNLPWIAALAGGLPAAAGVYLTSRVFDRQVDKISSLGYRVTGPWEDPHIEVERIFSDSAQ